MKAQYSTNLVKIRSGKQRSAAFMRGVLVQLIAVVAMFAFTSNVNAQINYTQGWEAAGNGGWVISAGGRSTSDPCTGVASMRRDIGGLTSETWTLTSPQVGTSNGLAANFSFTFRRSNSGQFGSMTSSWGTSPTGPWTTVNHSVTNTNCTNYSTAFTPPAGVPIYVQLTCTKNSGFFTPTRNYWFDNVSVQQQNLVCPEATFTPVDNCGANQFSINANVTVSGTAASLAYSVDGVPATPLSIPAPGSYSIGPFASTSTVTYELSNSQSAYCGPEGIISGTGYSNCPLTLDCGTVYTLQHCYTNNDERTFSFINPDPSGKVNIKFLPPSPIGSGDGVTFWEGLPNSVQYPLAGVSDLSTHDNILSPGNVFSFSIQSDATGSCADGGVPNDWQFEVKCVSENGCTEPQGGVIVTTDCPGDNFNLLLGIFSLGNTNNGQPAQSADIQYSVDGGPAQFITGVVEGIYDLGNFPLLSSVSVILLNEDDAVCNNNLGSFTKDIDCPAANDQCENAQPLPVIPAGTCTTGSISGTTVAATATGNPTCSPSGEIMDVWYTFNSGSFMPPITVHLTPGTIANAGMALYSSCGGSEIACASGSTTMTLPDPTPNTTYYLRVFTNTDFGEPGTFSVCVTAGVCVPSFSVNVEPICRVVFAGIDHTSNNAASETIAFQDLTSTVPPAQVAPGGTYSISVRGNTEGTYTNYFTVFFDWNNDGAYDLPGTHIGSITNNGNCGTAATTNITVPMNAMGGLTRMRIIKDWADPAAYPEDPCGTYDYGQAEDYAVNVACSGLPPVISISPVAPICAGQTLAFDVTSAGSIFSWVGPGGFTSSVEDPTITNAGASTAGTYTVVARSVVGGCGSSTAVNVTVSASPGPVNAGVDKTVCESTGSVQMTATAPTAGTGLWTKIGGGAANIVNATSPTASMNGLTAAGSPYTFRWTVSNDPCAAAFDDVIVTVDPAPTAANAGTDQSVCGNVSALLAANIPAIGTGAWSIVSGPSTAMSQFSSITDPAATFDPIAANGSYTLRWTISNGGCTASTNDMVISVMQSPGEPIATTSMAICEDTSVSAGEGLTASCPPVQQMTSAAFPGSNFPSEGTTLTTRSTLVMPALPAGAVVMTARLKLFNVVAHTGVFGVDGQRQNIRVALSGAYTLAQIQLTTQTGAGTITPDPVIDLPSFPATGGTINLRTRQTSDGFLTNPDATIGSASIEIDYTIPGVSGWFTAVSGGPQVGTGVFDPISAGQVNNSIPGSTTFYAGCVFNACGSITRLPATFTVNATPVVDAGEYSGVCSVDAPFELSGTPVNGTWSGTGVNGSMFDPAAGTQTLTYDHTDANGCSSSDAVEIAVTEATAWYADADGDGLGDPTAILMECDQPAGYVSDNTDACPNDPLNDVDGDGICGDVDGCPTVFGEEGWACDAGPGFILGELNSSCACVGIACSQNITVEIRTDNNGGQTTWEIREMNTDLLVCSGGPYIGLNNAALVNTCCLPDGCYDLSVFDSAGDGILNGGYILRMQGSNDRLIDNSSGFTSGSISSMMGTESFCVPIGTDKVIYTSCDKMDWMSNQFIVANPNAAVNAEWIPGAPNSQQDTDSGYEFWFFDPNGSYSFRRFRNHATPDNFGAVGATRACHMLINNWASALHIPTGVPMNVRVRSRVNGVNSQWGPACRFMIDPVAAQCPSTKLMDIPNNQFLSCGQFRNFSPGQYVHARPVSGATQYQFRFRQPAEAFEVIRTTSAYFLQLWWTGPLTLTTGSQYEVDVRAFKNGEWCPWGDICTLNIGSMSQGGQNLAADVTDQTDPEVAIWPNPNRGDELNISLSSIPEGTSTLTVDMFDLYGKKVMSRSINISDDLLNTVISLDDGLAAGVYMMNITAGENTYTQRLVIQR